MEKNIYKSPNGEELSGEEAHEEAMADFMGYGKDLDEGIFEKNSAGYKRTMQFYLNAADWLMKNGWR